MGYKGKERWRVGVECSVESDYQIRVFVVGKFVLFLDNHELLGKKKKDLAI